MYENLGDAWDAIGDGISSAGTVVCDVVNSMPGMVATNALLQYGTAAADNAATGAAGGALLARALCTWAGKGPTTGGGAAAAPQFPPGSIAAFDDAIGGYRVAIPLGSSAGYAAGGMVRGLGDPFSPLPGAELAAKWNMRMHAPYYWRNKYESERPYRSVASYGTLSAPAATHYEVIPRISVFPTGAGIQLVSLTEYQEKTGTLPWYKDTATWMIAGGGLLAVLAAWKLSQRKDA